MDCIRVRKFGLDLTRITGLNRSTVSDLIAELTELGLVHESEDSAQQGVGRPSLVVSAAKEVVSLAYSPTNESATLAAVALDGSVIGKVRRPLSGRPDPFEMARIAEAMAHKLRSQLDGEVRVSGIGATVPGPVDVRTGTVSFCEQLDWVDVEFGSYLANSLGLPAYVDNDSTVTCAAERDFGAGRMFDNSVYLFGGFGGIGGGVATTAARGDDEPAHRGDGQCTSHR